MISAKKAYGFGKDRCPTAERAGQSAVRKRYTRYQIGRKPLIQCFRNTDEALEADLVTCIDVLEHVEPHLLDKFIASVIHASAELLPENEFIDALCAKYEVS